MMAEQCAARRRDGTQCRGRPLPGDVYCFAHSPTLQAKRQAGAAKGGRHKANAHRARRDLLVESMTPAQLESVLASGIVQTAAGVMAPGVLIALATGARALIATWDAGEIAQRLAAVEAAAGLSEGRRGA